MQFSVESVGTLKKRISVEIPSETVTSEIDAAYGKLKGQVKMDGFRKGKVPRPLLERYYKDRVEHEVASKLIHDSLSMAISENELLPVSEPEVEAQSLASGSAFRYTATFEVKPEIDIKGYEGIRLEKEKVSVSEAMIDERVEGLRKNTAILKGVERPLKDGDTAVIDFEGFVDGVPFRGSKGEGVPLRIGSGHFVPGFEEQLVGMSSGDYREVSVKFPSNYHPDLAGRDAVFKVRLKEVKEEILPAVDDELAKDLGFGTLNELRDDIRKKVEEGEASRIRGKMKEQILETILERNPFDVPKSMIRKQRDYLLEDLRKRYERAGIKAGEELENSVVTDNLGMTALKQIKAALALTAIARKEGIEVTEKEIEERLKAMAAKNRVDFGMLRNFYIKNDLLGSLRSEILEEKVFDHIISKAEMAEA